MTRLAIVSDLHLEFQRWAFKPKYLEGVDVVIVAGDIDAIARTGGARAQEFFNSIGNIPTMVVLGNHDFYGMDLNLGHARWASFLAQWPNVHLLHRDFAMVGGYRFAGATLWTDFSLDGTPGFSSEVARVGISDFTEIGYRGGALHPDTMVLHHIEDRSFLNAIVRHDDVKTVVITHFVPFRAAIDPVWAGSKLNPYFTTDCAEWLLHPNVPLVCFGHTHSPFDGALDQTRVLCNPRGYPGEHPRRKHYKPVIVELP